MTEHTHAPLPYDWTAVGTAAYGNAFHAYLTDANGRKIAAIWGKAGEKEKTADLLMTAANNYARLLAALKEMRVHFGNPKEDEWLNAAAWSAALDADREAQAAIAQAEGRT